MKYSEMYKMGYEAGADYAIGRAFGDKAAPAPYFETPEDEREYYFGFDDGYNSVDD